MLRLILIIVFFMSVQAQEILTPNFDTIQTPRPMDVPIYQPRAPVYAYPNMTYPQQYSQYQMYYYQNYNYMAQSYPYMAYRGTGRNAPDYPFTGARDAGRTPQAKPFDGAKILHTSGKVSEKKEGVVGAKDAMQLWVQVAGATKLPPRLPNDQMAAVVSSISLSSARVIQKVEKVEDKILVSYKTENKSQGFYRDEAGEGSSGFLSMAVFNKTEMAVKFVDISSSSASDTTEPEDKSSFFLHSGQVSCDLKDWRAILDRNDQGGFNIALLKSEDVGKLRKLNLDEGTVKLLEERNYDKEVVYFTGRFFKSEPLATRIASRKIEGVIEKSIGSTRIQHRVQIIEKPKSTEDSGIDATPENSRRDLWFKGHFVIVDRPRDFYETPRWELKGPIERSPVETLD